MEQYVDGSSFVQKAVYRRDNLTISFMWRIENLCGTVMMMKVSSFEREAVDLVFDLLVHLLLKMWGYNAKYQKTIGNNSCTTMNIIH